MPSKVTRLVFNSAGFAAILKSQAVTADIARRAARIANLAGPGVESRVSVGRTRARAVAITVTREAMEREASAKTLTSAIGAGRG